MSNQFLIIFLLIWGSIIVFIIEPIVKNYIAQKLKIKFRSNSRLIWQIDSPKLKKQTLLKFNNQILNKKQNFRINNNIKLKLFLYNLLFIILSLLPIILLTKIIPQ